MTQERAAHEASLVASRQAAENGDEFGAALLAPPSRTTQEQALLEGALNEVVAALVHVDESGDIDALRDRLPEFDSLVTEPVRGLRSLRDHLRERLDRA